MFSCSTKKTNTETDTSNNKAAGATMDKIKLITLDPGHFHAALVQKTMYAHVDSVVHVYAPAGDDVQEHLKKIDAYNARAEDPTTWQEEVYTGADYLQKMLSEKKGIHKSSGRCRLKRAGR